MRHNRKHNEDRFENQRMGKMGRSFRPQSRSMDENEYENQDYSPRNSYSSSHYSSDRDYGMGATNEEGYRSLGRSDRDFSDRYQQDQGYRPSSFSNSNSSMNDYDLGRDQYQRHDYDTTRSQYGNDFGSRNLGSSTNQPWSQQWSNPSYPDQWQRREPSHSSERSNSEGYDRSSVSQYGNQYGRQYSGQGFGQNSEQNRNSQQYTSHQQPWSQQQSGQQAGKGPKGYRRSDERIREDLCEALCQRSGIDASDVEVTVSEGVATLTGQVESRQMKRMIEDCAEAVSGVKDVKNEIKIQASSSSRTQNSSESNSSSNKMNSSSKNTGSSSRHAQ